MTDARMIYDLVVQPILYSLERLNNTRVSHVVIQLFAKNCFVSFFEFKFYKVIGESN